jgi:hypothetical protein
LNFYIKKQAYIKMVVSFSLTIFLYGCRQKPQQVAEHRTNKAELSCSNGLPSRFGVKAVNVSNTLGDCSKPVSHQGMKFIVGEVLPWVQQIKMTGKMNTLHIK